MKKRLYLAYDQGMEHGLSDFDYRNMDPLFIINIAKHGYSGLIVQKGIAEKYGREIKKARIPLIIKLNGKTNIVKGEPLSRQICSVKEAKKLGAFAVGYTIYLGSEYEGIMLHEFSEIEREAHSLGLQAIAWIYPKGKSTEGRSKDELMEYSARVGLEIGADVVKLKYSGNPSALKKAVRAAGRTEIVISGGEKTTESKFLKTARDVMACGVSGMAVGRNVWEAKDPIALTKKLKRIVLGK